MISKSDIPVLAIALAILAACSVLLYLGFREPGGREGGRRVGTITYRYRVAQRRDPRSVGWRDVSQRSPVYNESFIRTDFMSEAIITLDDKTKIELDPHSMIFLQIGENEAQIELRKGSILVLRSVGGVTTRVRVRSDEEYALLSAGGARIRKRPDNSMQVIPLNGEVDVHGDAVVRKIGPGESAIASTRAVVVRKPGPALLLPVDNRRLFIAANDVTVSFSWQADGPATLEIAGDPGFGKIKRRKSAAKGKATIRLFRGEYYWRVTRRGAGGGPEYSDVRRLAIRQHGEINTLAPVREEVFRYVDSPPLVSFAWEKSEGAAEYILEIARKSDFSDGAKKKTVQHNVVSLPLEQGDYFWRVTARAGLPAEIARSPIGRFHVRKKNALMRPVLSRPGDGTTVGRIRLRREGLFFNWRQDTEIVRTELQISGKPDLSQPLLNTTVAANYFQLKQNLPPGKYYWRVRGRNQNGRESRVSVVQTFVVTSEKEAAKEATREGGVDEPEREKIPGEETTPGKGKTGETGGESAGKKEEGDRITRTQPKKIDRAVEKKRPEPPGQIRLLFPGPGARVDMTKRNSIPFRWSRVSGAKSYTFRLMFRGRTIHSATTAANHLKFTDLTKLDTGDFSWTVETEIHREGEIIRRSATGKFRITLREQPDRPEFDITR